MGFARQFDMMSPPVSGDAAMAPAGVGPVASMHRILFENFDTETCAPLLRSAGNGGWFESSISRVSRVSGVAMLVIAYIGAAYLASGLI